jgi:RimJ/RimL family protein N-acetyltransferase
MEIIENIEKYVDQGVVVRYHSIVVIILNGGLLNGATIFIFNQEEPIEFKTWELGYGFNPKFYGQGYATEACKRILKYGFEEKNAHRIVAEVNVKNESSWKLLERLSMRREGHML